MYDAASCTSCDNVNHFRVLDPVNKVCNCMNNYLDVAGDNTCLACNIVCAGCVTTVNTCIACASTTRWGVNCICKVGYRDIGEVACEACAFRCKACASNKNVCDTCLGDRINAPSCVAPDGKYDDGVSEMCENC